MNEVSSIGKFLEPLSEAYAHIPFEGYGIAGILRWEGDRVRRTVSYADTTLQAHAQTKASAAT